MGSLGGRWAPLGKGSLSIRLPTSQEMACGKTSLGALGNYLQTLLYSRPVGTLVINRLLDSFLDMI